MSEFTVFKEECISEHSRCESVKSQTKSSTDVENIFSQIELNELKQIEENVTHIKNNINFLKRASTKYSSEDLRNFRDWIENDNKLSHEFNSQKYEQFSKKEMDYIAKKYQHKKQKFISRFKIEDAQIQKLNDLRDFEMSTRQIWNIVLMQVRIKLLFSCHKTEPKQHKKYQSLQLTLNDLFKQMQVIPFFEEPCLPEAINELDFYRATTEIP